MKWIRRALVFLVAAAAVLAIVWAMLPKPVNVDVATVRQGELVATVDELGHTRVQDRYIVSAPVAGSLARIELAAGAEVEAGAVLAHLLPSQPPLLDARSRAELESRLGTARAALAQAVATVERARVAEQYATDELNQLTKLTTTGAVTLRDRDRATLERDLRNKERRSAEFAADAAHHEVTATEATLARMSDRTRRADEQVVLTSPVRGRVLRVLKQDEGVIAPGQPLLELGNPAALEIVVDVLTSDAIDITSGAQVEIVGWGGAPLPGRVRLVEPSATTKISALGVEEQRVTVVVDLVGPADQWARLGDNWRVETRITVWRGADVIQVASSALFRRGESWAVFVLEGGKARLRNVEIGRRSGGTTAVTKGLAVGERVIIYPSDRVDDGVAVQVREGATS